MKSISKRHVAVILSIAVVLIGLAYWWSNPHTLNFGLVERAVETDDAAITSLAPAHVPDGWTTYVNEEWGIALAYPGEWGLKEGVLTGEVSRVNITSGCVADSPTNCEFIVTVTKGVGRGLPDYNWEHPEYVIDGTTAKAWQALISQDPLRHHQIIGVEDKVLFSISAPDLSLTDQILSTVKFKK